MKKLFLYVAMLLPLFTSCSNDEEQTPTDDEKFTLEITWNKVQYSVPCSLDKNGKLIYWDENFQQIWNKEISQYDGKSLTTYVIGDGKIAYYPSVDDMMKDLGLQFLGQKPTSDDKISTTRTVSSSSIAGTVTMWSNNNFSGTIMNHRTYYTLFYWCARLSNLKYNDTASSIRVISNIPQNDSVYVNYSDVEFQFNEGTAGTTPYTGSNKYYTNDLRLVFLGYEDKNYGGNVLCMVPDNTSHKQYAALSSIGWNNMISSDVIRIAVKNLYTDHH